MELRDIVDRFAEGIPFVDRATSTQNANQRTKDPFLVSAFNLKEAQLVSEISEWWSRAYQAELPTHSLENLEFPYPGLNDQFCDLVVGSVSQHRATQCPFDWAIEVKRIQLVGDNGKNNDYGITKLISPYRKDRSVTHDAERLSLFDCAKRRAVIVVGFDFSAGADARALAACKRLALPELYAKNLASVLRKENVSSGQHLLDPAIEIADIALRRMNLTNSERYARRFSFSDVTRHPCGAEGVVVGWEIATATDRISDAETP